ncbi:MAG: serine/threonine protein kinase [Cetobacterium sp.]
MKKLLAIIFGFIILQTQGFSMEYNYPLKDPYMATILGSSTLMAKGVPSEKNIPIEDYTINMSHWNKISKSLWYEKGLKFSLSAQKKPAPLIFVLSGTGAKYDSSRTKIFQRIFYGAGYNVITVSSVFSNNFLTNGSSTKMPGMLMVDGRDLYNSMWHMYDKIKDKVQVTDFYVMGYSLGATHSAIVSYLDEKEHKFNFKRVYMVNPSVSLYTSAMRLDEMLNKNINNNNKNIQVLVERVINKAADYVRQSGNLNIELDEETIYKIFEKEEMSENDMEALIGLAFRLTAVDINYLTDLLTHSDVYVKKPVGKFTNMFPYFEAVDFASFKDYMNRLAFPYYDKLLKRKFTMEDLIETTDLSQIQNYLKDNPKIAAVTNADDFILTNENREFLEKTFKNRFLLYPYGGHCGNMFYESNIKTMLNFLNGGTLKYEE